MPNYYKTRATGQELDQLPDLFEKVKGIEQEVSQQKEDIADLQNGAGGGKGWTSEQINLLDELLNHVQFIDITGGLIADRLIASLRRTEENPDIPDEPDVPDEPIPEVVLTRISAVYNGSDVDEGTDADTLDVTVTAHYSDGSSRTVTGWTIEGVVQEGENVFTISFEGMTTTITVVGLHVEKLPFVSGQPYSDYGWTTGWLDWTNGEIADPSKTDAYTTDFLPCHGANRLMISGCYQNYRAVFYDENKNLLTSTPTSYVVMSSSAPYPLAVPPSAYYVRTTARSSGYQTASIVPYKDPALDANTVAESGAFYAPVYIGNKYPDSTNGTHKDSANTKDFMSEFMLVNGFTHYLGSSGARHTVRWYDADKNYISTSTIQNITTGVDIPSGAVYATAYNFATINGCDGWVILT